MAGWRRELRRACLAVLVVVGLAVAAEILTHTIAVAEQLLGVGR